MPTEAARGAGRDAHGVGGHRMHAARCRRGVVQIGAALIVAACSRPGASVLPAAVSEGDAVVLVRGPTSLTAGGVGDWHHATLDRAADGRALVVWQDGSGGAGFHTRWFAEDLQPRSPDVVTRDTGARVSHPQGLIVDGEGWVAWQAHDGAIRAQRCLGRRGACCLRPQRSGGRGLSRDQHCRGWSSYCRG